MDDREELTALHPNHVKVLRIAAALAALPFVIGSLVLEVAFEYEFFAYINGLSPSRGYDVTTRGTMITMLLAHWLYWGAALLGIPALMGFGQEPEQMLEGSVRAVRGSVRIERRSSSISRRSSSRRDSFQSWAANIRSSSSQDLHRENV